MWTCPKCKRAFKNTNQNHFCVKPENVDEYIAAQAPEVQPLLQQIRDTIRAAAPDCTEKISQHMPTFWQKKNLVQIAAHKSHIGFYPGDEAVLAFAERLADYKTNKGCIHLMLDQPMDYDLIADIVRWRVSHVVGAPK
ncbi:MAG: DUF1801 domain-containing protein [Oscillospiraceae bacterium]|nr:DUF1801 domain-containing protein [Oscillospiraceae bacterium]